MKYIFNKRTGSRIKNLYEARTLVSRVKKAFPFVQSDDHRAPHGHASPSIAEKANLRAIIEAHEGYISVFEGSEDCGFNGYKAVFIGFKSLPEDFETYFPEYTVVGN